MTKDSRLFIPLSLDFVNHWKIRPLSDKAFRTFLEMLSWTTEQGLDGFIPAGMFATFGTAKARQELMTNDPVRPSVREVDGGYQLHDFEKHNRLRAEIEDLKSKRAAAGAKGGRAKANAKQLPEQSGQQNGGNFYPDVRSQMTDRQDTHTSSPVGNRESYPQVTDEGVSESEEQLCSRHAALLGVDYEKARSALVKATGRIPAPTDVVRIIATILERASGPVQSPTGLVIASARSDWAEWQKLLDDRRVA